MNIPELIKESHDNAVERGFYDCVECGGNGLELIETNNEYPDEGAIDCHVCSGTGIDPNRNIGELLMLIVSELGEALEAHRKGVYGSIESFEFDTIQASDIDLGKAYHNYLKDTFEDELADVFIRLFDLCGYLDLKDVYFEEMTIDSNNVGEMLLRVCKEVTNYHFTNNKTIWMAFCLASVSEICKILNIPIEKHIRSKQAYNRTRPRKHGKDY